MKKPIVFLVSLMALAAAAAIWLQAAMPAGPPDGLRQTARRTHPRAMSQPILASPPLATPTVGAPSTTPSMIVVNTPTTVTITASIAPAPIANSVNLLRLGATGTQQTILGVMRDDGRNGDVIAGDGIYTLQVPFNEQTSGQIQVEVSAAFQGLLKRILSPIIQINVWTLFSSSSSALPSFAYPPTWSPITATITTDTNIDVCPPADDLCSSGLTVSTTFGTMSNELADLATGVQVVSQTALTINSIQWTLLITSDPATGGQYVTALAQHGSYVQSVSGVYSGNTLTTILTVLTSIQ